MISPMIWKKVPEVGDKIRAYVTHPLAVIMEVRPYTGRYPQHFTHVIRYTSPITGSRYSEACWPLAGACWVLKR